MYALDTDQLLSRLDHGDDAVLGDLLSVFRERLRAMIRLRMDRRLQGRLDESDVIQDAYLEATSRIQEYIENKPMPFFLWLRSLAGEQLINQQRRHLGAARRDVRREISLYQHVPDASSALLAARLVGAITAPADAAIRHENKLEMERALESLSEVDREILALRHFEQMSRRETSLVLGISCEACSKRYVRAMKRLGLAIESPAATQEESRRDDE